MCLRALRCCSKRNICWQPSRIQVRWTSAKASLPLRILFCGSDKLSVACLEALREEQHRDPEGIESIDVLIRPAKPYGRSLKQVREVPIKAVAKELGLEVHERDTFTGWDLPTPGGKPINLLVAVSFGLFVPPRILQSAYYGGINIHPSLLPNYRGPAPLHHILLSKSTFTGVTLQTLDEKAFDHGKILAQTPQKDCKMPDLFKLNYEQLLQRITPMAASQLVDGIRNRLFVPPLVDAGWYQMPEKSLVHARKLTKDDQQIKWDRPSNEIERQHRALGRLWNELLIDRKTSARVIFEDMTLVPIPEHLTTRLQEKKHELDGLLKPHPLDMEVHFLVVNDVQQEPSEFHDGRKVLFYVKDEEDAVIIAAANDKTAIRVKNITIGGKGSKPAAIALKPFSDNGAWQLRKHHSKQTQAFPNKLGSKWLIRNLSTDSKSAGIRIALTKPLLVRTV